MIIKVKLNAPRTGWAFLTITTNSSVSDEEQARAAGIGEGYATATRILQMWKNTMSGLVTRLAG